MPTMRIARIVYDHVELKYGPNGQSIGQQVDAQLIEMVKQGHLIQEVSVFAEGIEEQTKLREMYLPQDEFATVAEAGAVGDDGYRTDRNFKSKAPKPR
jgi:hypothetical protein